MVVKFYRQSRKTPVSVYKVGEELLLQLDQKDARVSRGGVKVGQQLSEKVTVVEADVKHYRYKVKTKFGKLKWVTVSKLTSCTREDEKNRSQKGNFMIK